jgi:hypothetical protein
MSEEHTASSIFRNICNISFSTRFICICYNRLVHEHTLTLMFFLFKNALDVDPILYTLDWYMTLFSRTYRAPQLFRIWDMFFCEGVKVLFRLALVILRETLDVGASDIVTRAHRCDNAMELVGLIKATAKSLTFDELLIKMDKLPLTDIDLAQACGQARQQLSAESNTINQRRNLPRLQTNTQK